MRTVDYSEVLSGSAALAGMKFPDDIGTAELALFSSFHDGRLQTAWEIEGWPDICRVEKRYYRPKWSASADAYSAGDERFDQASGQYFQSLRDSNYAQPPTAAMVINAQWWAVCQASYGGPDYAAGTHYNLGDVVRNPADGEFYQCLQTGTPAMNPAFFGRLTPFIRRVEFVQVEDGTGVGNGTAHTIIGEILRAHDKDPRVTTKVVDLPFTLDDSGAIFVQVQKAVTFVWLTFRTRRPQLSGLPWDSALVYTAGRQVYYLDENTGVANFYVANAPTTVGQVPPSSTKWDVVEIPYVFSAYLQAGGFADWLVSDGQAEKAQAQEASAQSCLEQEADKLWRQQGQARRLNWKR